MAFGFSSGTFTQVGPGLYLVDFNAGISTAHFANGLEKLAFEVFFCLFTTQGTIPADSTFGTLLRQIIGQMGIGVNTTTAATFITNEIVKAENQILSRQSAAALPLTEQLKRIVIDEVLVDRSTQTATIRMFIVNQLEQTVGFEIPNVGGTA